MVEDFNQEAKKIVICCREWSSSTGRYARNLVNQLQEIDSTNEYVILLSEKDFAKWTPRNGNFKKMVCKYEDYSLGEQLGLKRMLEGLKPDVVHFTMTQQPVLYQGRVITTMHDLTILRFDNPSKNWLIFNFKKFIYSLVCRIVAKKSLYIISPTEYVKTDVASYTGVNSSKIYVTYEGSDSISDTPQEIKGLAGKEYIMYVGRPNPHKNLDRLIESFALISKPRPGLVLVLAGKKDILYQELEEKYKDRGLNIYFTDFVSEGELRWLYEHCRAYVFPSLSEGFGLPGLEAMNHRAPVVSSSATCLPEVYGSAAVYFDPYNLQDMSDKIMSVISNDALRQDLIEKGLERVKLYSWRRMAEETHELYELSRKRK